MVDSSYRTASFFSIFLIIVGLVTCGKALSGIASSPHGGPSAILLWYAPGFGIISLCITLLVSSADKKKIYEKKYAFFYACSFLIVLTIAAYPEVKKKVRHHAYRQETLSILNDKGDLYPTVKG